jgi:hypothetical protein
MTTDCVPNRPAFQSQLMDRDALGQWLLRKLGAPVWCVELTQDMIEDAIDDAIRWFAAKKGAFRWSWFDVLNGQVAYPLPSEVDLVIDLAFESPQSDISLIFSPFLMLDEKVPYDVFAAPQSMGIYSSYVQTLQYIETAKRVLGAELDWEQRDRCLYVSPTPRQNFKAIYEYKTSVFNINQLPERDHVLIKQYALAQAMITLGLIRSKFGGFPGAQGDQSLNGDRLIDMGNERIEKLDEEIMLSGYPMGFCTG